MIETLKMLPDRYGTWKPIPSQPGWWASSLGYVKREAGPSVRRPDLRVPETAPTRGYPRVTSFVINIKQPNGSVKTRAVGRLICEAFHGACPSEEHWAMHLDGNPYNNAADNLAWRHRSERKHLRQKRMKRTIVRIPND